MNDADKSEGGGGPMTILGIDCAGAACSAAIVRGTQTLAERSEAMSRGQAERIVPMIAEVLDTASSEATALDAVAVTVGPGAFTGVRIGLAAALGIARVTNIPVVGVTVTEAIAEDVPVVSGARLLIALDSKRADPFCAVCVEKGGRWHCNDPVMVRGTSAAMHEFSPPNNAPLIVAGDGAEQAVAYMGYGEVSAACATPSPAQIAKLGAKSLADGTNRPAEPLYLREPDVSAPSRDRASRPQASPTTQP